MTWDEIIGRIFFGLLCGGGFLFFSGVNYSILYKGLVKHEKTSSPTPLLGGICGVFLLLIVNGTKHLPLLLIPLVIDPGCLLLLLELIVLLAQSGIQCIMERFKNGKK